MGQTFIATLSFLLVTISGTLAQSQETHLLVQNLAKENIITTVVTGVDEFDWSGNSGPQHNFEDIQIAAGTWYQQQEDVYALASNCPFTMLLMFSDGTRDEYTINMKFANGEAQANFLHEEGERDIQYSRIGSNTLLINVKDNGTYCTGPEGF